jgi:glycosyltransferase involved in cell wall biosynthesis
VRRVSFDVNAVDAPVLGDQRDALAPEIPPSSASSPAGPAEAAEPADWSGWGVCTIVSRNYLSLARACCRSFLEHHRGARAFVLLADTLDGVDPAKETFQVMTAAALGIPHYEDFTFKYGILELNTAVKPYFLQELLERHGVRNLVCLDPDVFVYGPFHEVRHALERHTVVLTPHALSPIGDDQRRPTERDFLVSGAYNLGFVGMRACAETSRLLAWWQAKLYDGAFSEPARGLFTDQKWMDLVPCFFEGAGVLRHPGYNVAYWNLHERRDLAPAPDGGYTVAGVPLRFFHFSGFDKRHPEVLSKHQDRHRLADLGPDYRALFADYGRALDENGWTETCGVPYAYGAFDNGAPVPDLARRLWREQGPGRVRFGNPFCAEPAGSFFRWLVTPESPDAVLSPLLRAMRDGRPDLVDAFPDPGGRDLKRYLEWIVDHHREDFGLGEPYTTFFRGALARAERRGTAARTPGQPASLADEASVDGLPATRLKRMLAALIGEGRYQALRREIVWPLYSRLRGDRDPREAAAAGPSRARIEAAADVPRPFGVNLFGYLDTESGVGETGRGFAALLEAGGIPHALVNLEQRWLRRADRRLKGFTHARPYAIDLLVVNPDQLPAVYRQFGLRRGAAYDVGFWAWELALFPRARFGEALGLVDEIWTHSEFCRGAFASAATVPVEKVVPALVFDPPERVARAEFGLDEAFTFLFVYDAASIVTRKNPGAAVSAFRRAFSPGEPVQLVLKTVNATPRHAAALRRLAGGARVRVLGGYLSRDAVVRLIAACDAYVSLHRSEGLGLSLIEALMMGKPVVATRYSGVTEFLEGPGAFPVAFSERTLRRDHGPYPHGAVWAEPDAADAARQMRAVYKAWADPAGRPHDVGAQQRARYGIAGTLPAFMARLAAIRGRLEASRALAR